MSILLVLSVATVLGFVGLEIARRTVSGRRLERSLDALRTLGDTIEASSTQQTPELAAYRDPQGRMSIEASALTTIKSVSRAS